MVMTRIALGAAVGALSTALGAIVASLCCAGPAVLALLGTGGVLALARLEPYRPYLLAVSFFFLLAAFGGVYRARTVCRSKQRWRMTTLIRTVLWISAVALIVGFCLPYIS
jgi:mercuric ion transport protein